MTEILNLLGSPGGCAWFSGLFNQLYAKVFLSQRDDEAFAWIDRCAMCAGVEIVGENNTADYFKLHAHSIELYLLARHPFPTSRAESCFFRIVERELMSFFKPFARRQLHQFLKKFFI